MSNRRSNRNNAASKSAALLCATFCALPITASALSTDRQQTMKVTSAYSKLTQGNAKAAGSAYLKGNVRIEQGSMKATGAEATLHQHPDGARNARGEDVSGDIQRIVLVGSPAHIEQLQDNGGGLMTADAAKIDYDADTGIAVLTGGVKVVQQGRGTFNGEHMTYNTNTGEMESGNTASNQPITMTFEPKKKAPPAKPSDAQPKKADADGTP